MKEMVAFSDSHSMHYRIKAFQDVDGMGQEKEPLSGELIAHAGDATASGSSREIEEFIIWYGKLKFKHKLFTPGNHDLFCEKDPATVRRMCEDNGVIFLNHEPIVIEGKKIFASPWTPYFFDWAFNAGRTITEAAVHQKRYIGDLWKDIPKDTQILITHGPPYDILDELLYVDGTPKGQFVGCTELRKVVEEIKPEVHIFGHVHCGYGQKHVNGTSFYNVAVCDEMYTPSNEITLIQL